MVSRLDLGAWEASIGLSLQVDWRRICAEGGPPRVLTMAAICPAVPVMPRDSPLWD